MSEKQIEEMSSFFNERSNMYDDHMRETIEEFDKYYKTLANEIVETNQKIHILDLGCGTGAELEYIFRRVPNATVTCVDLSEDMVNELKIKYKDKLNQFEFRIESYLDMDYEKYDYIVSVMTMHHWTYSVKRGVYKKICKALNDGGKYLEGDYYVDYDYELELIKRREELLKDKDKNVFYHIDIPFSRKTQEELYLDAGFKDFSVEYAKGGKEIHVMK